MVPDQRIDEIDRLCQIVRVAQTEPTEAESTWAEATDLNDLHLKLLARAARAEYVVSWNTHDFPARREVHGFTRGELEGVVWITPDQLPLLGELES